MSRGDSQPAAATATCCCPSSGPLLAHLGTARTRSHQGWREREAEKATPGCAAGKSATGCA
eukprot:3138522-Pleurochrysis_carterae.AAC.1